MNMHYCFTSRKSKQSRTCNLFIVGQPSWVAQPFWPHLLHNNQFKICLSLHCNEIFYSFNLPKLSYPLCQVHKSFCSIIYTSEIQSIASYCSKKRRFSHIINFYYTSQLYSYFSCVLNFLCFSIIYWIEPNM